MSSSGMWPLSMPSASVHCPVSIVDNAKISEWALETLSLALSYIVRFGITLYTVCCADGVIWSRYRRINPCEPIIHR